MKKAFNKGRQFVSKLVGNWWYDPLVAFLAAADAFILILSIEALFLPSVFAKPKKWYVTPLYAAFGSALGAVLLALVISQNGEALVNSLFKGALQSEGWKNTVSFLDNNGFLGLFLIALGPIPQHFGVAIAGLAHMNPFLIFGSLLAGRIVKYLFISWAMVHSPKLLRKLKLISPADLPHNRK